MKLVVNEITPERCPFSIFSENKCMVYNGRCIPDMIVDRGRVKECSGCITADWLSAFNQNKDTIDQDVISCQLFIQTKNIKDKLNSIYGEPKGENNG